MLNVGDVAPQFTLSDQHGEALVLEELVRAGPLILYFYPADFSPVCTAEACVFRDSYRGVADIGVQIVGISPQSSASHKRFASTFSIPFPLLSDPRKTVIKAYGVDGPFGFGVRRVTYLVDDTMTIRNRVVSDLSVSSHAQLLRDVLKEAPRVS